MARVSPKSTTARKMDMSITTTKTTRVVTYVSCREGQWTFLISCQASLKNSTECRTASAIFCVHSPMRMLNEMRWRVRQDSNLQQPDLESGALASWSY